VNRQGSIRLLLILIAAWGCLSTTAVAVFVFSGLATTVLLFLLASVASVADETARRS
jgi:hypothetical protein